MAIYSKLPAGKLNGKKPSLEQESASRITLKIQNTTPTVNFKDSISNKQYHGIKPGSRSVNSNSTSLGKTQKSRHAVAQKSLPGTNEVKHSVSNKPTQILVPNGVPFTPPKRIKFVQPSLTRAARRAMLEGVFRVDLSIDAKGKVIHAQMRDFVGFGMDSRIEKAMKNAQFSPAKNSKGLEIAVKLIDSVEIIQL